MIALSGAKKTDIVLEIGPGLGFITKELAKKVKKVIAVEIDKRFRSYLFNFPRNIDFIFENILTLLKDGSFRQRTKPPKIVISNIPYGAVQSILINFLKSSWYKGDFVFVAPASLIDKINNEAVLGKYFQAKLIEKISPEVFYPIPNTIPVLIYLKRIKFN